MESFIANLKTHYSAVLESGSDGAFYQGVHDYIDYILRTPALATIINKSEEEYKNRHKEIWGDKPSATDREADEKEEATHRLEHFSLYAADYAILFARIYVWLEEYKNATEPDPRPYPAAIVMLRGINGIDTKLWSKKTLEQYGKWYTGKRKMYENRLKNFHNSFMTELEKIPKQNDPVVKTEKITSAPIAINQPEKPTIPLSLNLRTGDFVFYNTKGNFSPAGQEFKVLKALYNDKDYQATYLSLLQSYNPGIESVSKTHKSALSLVIRNIKQELQILPESKTSNPDVFKNYRNLGYRLVFEPEKVRTE